MRDPHPPRAIRAAPLSGGTGGVRACRRIQGAAARLSLALLGIMNGAAADPALPLTFSAALELAERNAPQLTAEAAKIGVARSAAIPPGELPDPRLFFGIEGFPVPKVIFHILFVKNVTDYSAGIG
jgi:outer membrane protein, heavy metal efflux system